MTSQKPQSNHKAALHDIEDRISAMDRRLRNAKAARDSYVDFLKNKYPDWRPALPSYSKPLLRSSDNLVGMLATSDYHWDQDRLVRPRLTVSLEEGRLYNQIPRGRMTIIVDGRIACRGPYLATDLKRMRERLSEIREQMKVMTHTRMNLTTEDYFRTQVVRKLELGSLSDSDDEIPTLVGAKKRLADMALSTVEPVVSPTTEELQDSKFKLEREQMVEDIRAGRIPSVLQNLPPIEGNEPTFIQQTPILYPYHERNLISNAPKVEPSAKIIEASTAPTTVQPRRTITFSDAVEVKTVPARATEPETPSPAPVAPEPKKEAPKPQSSLNIFEKEEKAKPAESSYSKMLSLFSRKDTTSDSDSDVMGVPAKTTVLQKPVIKEPPKAVQLVPEKKEETKRPTSLLSQYLTKAETSSSDDVFKSTLKKDDDGLDSDSDFFG